MLDLITPVWVTVYDNGYVEEHDTKPDLPALNSAVRGHIESVPLNALGRTLTVLCNEEGKLMGLPPNRAANRILGDLLYGDDIIVGPVVFTGPVDEVGELLPLGPKDWATMVYTLNGLRSEDGPDAHLEADYEDAQNGGE